ncbi:MAG: hypothetical protein AAGH78_00555 [Cyanobacteria bacterium P01_H01_bin.58]
MFEALATFLLKELGQTIKNWSVRIQQVENDEPEEEVKQLQQPKCPLRPRFPDSDYLEAMLGDLLEWQSYLKKRGLSKCHILLLTLLGVIELAIDVLRITLQNMFDVIQSAQQPEVIDSSMTAEVLTEGTPPDTDSV